MNRDWGTEGWRASGEASVVEKPTTSPLSSSAVATALMPPRFPRSIHSIAVQERLGHDLRTSVRLSHRLCGVAGDLPTAVDRHGIVALVPRGYAEVVSRR